MSSRARDGRSPAGGKGIQVLKNTLLAAPFLVGSWFGTGQPDDRSQMWLAHMLPDGRFEAQFRSCVKGKGMDEVETGRWSLKGDSETIQVMMVNGQPFARRDEYKIEKFDKSSQTYRYLKTGYVYSSRRVADSFEMPSCEAIS